MGSVLESCRLTEPKHFDCRRVWKAELWLAGRGVDDLAQVVNRGGEAGRAAGECAKVLRGALVSAKLATDPINTLSGEMHLLDGAGSQQDTVNRWGDYSAMAIDQVDQRTFWYTIEYYDTTSSFNWRTRIGNFMFHPW